MAWTPAEDDLHEVDRELRASAPSMDLPSRLGLDEVRRRLFPELQDAQSPPKVGRFVVQRRVGAGGMGVVFEAWDPELGRKIALKVLRDVRSERKDALGALAEARTLAKLRHPNIVSVHDVGIHDGQMFIAMDFIEGLTLRQWMKQPHPQARIIEVFVSIAQGLERRPV